MLALIAGVVLAAILQLRIGAGHPADIDAGGSGTAVVATSPSTAVPPGLAARFSINGSVNGLYPGASLPLVLKVSNPLAFAIDVTSITTAVGTPNAGCAGTNLLVTPFAGDLPVPAKGTATATVSATLNHSTPDACQGVVFPLTYSGTAVKQ